MSDYDGRHRIEDLADEDDDGHLARFKVWWHRVTMITNNRPGAPLPDPPAHRTDPRGE